MEITRNEVQQKSVEFEIWKDVENYEGLYQISNLGNIRRKGKLLKIRVKKRYNAINLSKNNKNTTYNIHRLVALAFVENIDNKPLVDHIDGNKKNNNYINLRWVTSYENSQNNENTPTNPSIAVCQYDNNNVLINTYKSIKEAALCTKGDASDISRCIRGIRNKTAGGFIWKKYE